MERRCIEEGTVSYKNSKGGHYVGGLTWDWAWEAVMPPPMLVSITFNARGGIILSVARVMISGPPKKSWTKTLWKPLEQSNATVQLLMAVSLFFTCFHELFSNKYHVFYTNFWISFLLWIFCFVCTFWLVITTCLFACFRVRFRCTLNVVLGNYL